MQQYEYLNMVESNIEAHKRFVYNQTYFQLSMHEQIHLELVDIMVTILGLMSYNITVT